MFPSQETPLLNIPHPQVYAMLFTDLLLLTKEVGQHLKVVQDPMFLSQIMIQDFNCDDGTEFHITVVATLVRLVTCCVICIEKPTRHNTLKTVFLMSSSPYFHNPLSLALNQSPTSDIFQVDLGF